MRIPRDTTSSARNRGNNTSVTHPACRQETIERKSLDAEIALQRDEQARSKGRCFSMPQERHFAQWGIYKHGEDYCVLK